MVAIQNGEICSIPLEEAASGVKGAIVAKVYGKDLAESEKLAWQMAEEAEALGDKDVFYRLGKTYSAASNQKDHLPKAFECYKRAAENGIPAAMAALGLCYEAGLGIEEDIARAVSFYKRSAEAGDPFGMAHYGYALANGEGCEKNEKAAMSWLIKAAMRGDQGAILTLKEDYGYEMK